MLTKCNIVFGIFFIFSSKGLDYGCGTNYKYPYNVFLIDDKCYEFVPENQYWFEAKDFCEKESCKLIELDNEKLLNSIKSLLSTQFNTWNDNVFWIGLNYNQTIGRWVWTNSKGEPQKRLDDNQWSNWDRGKPTSFLSYKKDCVAMYRGPGSWKWSDVYCGLPFMSYKFICQCEVIKLKPQQLIQTTDSEVIVEKSLPVKEKVLKTNKIEKESNMNFSSVLIFLIIVILILLIVCALLLYKLRKVTRKTSPQPFPFLVQNLYQEPKNGEMEMGEGKVRLIKEEEKNLKQIEENNKLNSLYEILS